MEQIGNVDTRVILMDIKKYYDPPDKEEGMGMLEAYCVGFLDALCGVYRQEELYPGSGHERATLYEDELAFQYFRGTGDGLQASTGSKD